MHLFLSIPELIPHSPADQVHRGPQHSTGGKITQGSSRNGKHNRHSVSLLSQLSQFNRLHNTKDSQACHKANEHSGIHGSPSFLNNSNETAGSPEDQPVSKLSVPPCSLQNILCRAQGANPGISHRTIQYERLRSPYKSPCHLLPSFSLFWTLALLLLFLTHRAQL